MEAHVSHKYRVYPTDGQLGKLARWQDALRFLWNLGLEQWKLGLRRPKGERIYPTKEGQQKELTELRKNVPWLDELPRHVAGMPFCDLEAAWKACFEKRSKTPRWKRKGEDFLSLTETDSKVWALYRNGKYLHFPKLGKMPIRMHRPLAGKATSCTLSRDGDEWYVSILCKVEKTLPERNEASVGLDRGCVNVVADSDGTLVVNPKFYINAERVLKRAQRKMSRKVRGSKNEGKAKARVTTLHRRVRRQREHFLHTLSYRYSKSHGIIGVEKLGTYDMVRVGNGLAKSILDAGWGKFLTYLKYKVGWENGTVVEVPAAYTSQDCNFCSYQSRTNRKSQSEFRCAACGHTDNADLNAAKNIHDRAKALFEARVIHSGLPVEGFAPGAPQRSRKGRFPRKRPTSNHLKELLT